MDRRGGVGGGVGGSAAERLDARLPNMMALEHSLCVVPLVSHGAVECLSRLRPSRGRDWAEPLLLEWSLALELRLAGRIAAIAPVRVGRLRPDGTVSPWVLERTERARGRADGGGGGGGGGGLADEVSKATFAAMHHIASRRYTLELSQHAARRTIRGVVEEILACGPSMQWAELRRPAEPPEAAGRAAAVAAGGGSAEPVGGDGGALERVCIEMAFGEERGLAPLLSAAQLGVAEGGSRLSVRSQLAAAAGTIDEAVQAAAARRASGLGAEHRRSELGDRSSELEAGAQAVDAARGVGAARGAMRHGDSVGAGTSVRLDRSSIDQLLRVAGLSPAEHERALEAASSWCHAEGMECADDLLGGGVDLEADTELWDSLMRALDLASPILVNRLRRELVRRRGRMLEGAGPGPEEEPAPASGSRRSCELQ